MHAEPSVLLLDDGELNDVARLLDRSSVPYTRRRGSEVGDDIAPPMHLLITTPRHASKVRPGSSPGASPGRPVRIIAVEEDSPSLRRMLRTMGFSLLVRQPAHGEVWRLLIQRALYQGDERRRDTRLPIGTQIRVGGESQSSDTTAPNRSSILVDISNRGCHFVGEEPFVIGARVAFKLGERITGSSAIELSGEVVRAIVSTDNGIKTYRCGMAFDPHLDDATRLQLARMINSKIIGPLSLSPRPDPELSLPTCDSHALPGLELDDETDPPVSTDFEVDLAVSQDASSLNGEEQRRKNHRGDYFQRVETECLDPGSDLGTSVLMGRDLSATGMRVERFADAEIGAQLTLAIYGPSETEPLYIDAEIMRDDDERGIALRFSNLSRETAAILEKFVACLPAVESLEDGEAASLGAVLARVLPADHALHQN
jgi:c-di-GMP-binding flagellar brake protein YcgR